MKAAINLVEESLTNIYTTEVTTMDHLGYDGQTEKAMEKMDKLRRPWKRWPRHRNHTRTKIEFKVTLMVEKNRL